MFATVIIILQSPFTGGEAHLSHGGLSTVVDHSGNSLLSTSVMAWYTDVTHEIKPITSGYRLALSYNLIHTTTTLRPSLPSTHQAALRLKEIFTIWKERGHTAPQKIIYLLEHRYSRANLKGSALKGSDSHEVALLKVAAEETGFRVGLANIECHVTGTADDEGHGYYRSHRGPHSESDSDDAMDVEMLEVSDTEWSITNLVDLSGHCIANTLHYDDDTDETIPADLHERVEDGPVDEAEYEGYQGNVSEPSSRI